MADVTAVILTAQNIEVHYGEQVILNKASLTLHEGDRIGLVGRNGTGKSTFLKIISGILEPDAGEIAKTKNLVIGYLPQEFTLEDNKTVHDNIISGAKETLALLEEYNRTPFDSPRKVQLEEMLLHRDGWNIEKQAEVLIKSLNAPPGDRMVSGLSGGEKRRVALCRALISKPDLLILDEPTNHLDISSIEWMESFLAGYSATSLFVTHDRYFLDKIANRIVELQSGVFYSHQGSYTDYLINKGERQSIKESEEKKRQNFLRRELDWVMRGPRARRTKAKSRLDNYYEVAGQDNLEVELDVNLVIPPAEKLGNKVVELKDVSMELGGKQLFRHINLALGAGRKLGIVGENGAGKTTFLKVVLGMLEPVQGKIEIGEKTRFNYVDQSRMLLNDDETVIQSIGEGKETISFGNGQMPVWTYLRRFLFTDDRINTIVGRLSGGERSRLALARILKNGGNFLILDEPTNDLDLPTLRILEEALIAFEGCVMVVSHDRYFLNRVCNGILAFEGNGEVYFSEGDYDYYLEKKKARLAESSAKDDADKKIKKEETRGAKPKAKKLSYKEQKEFDGIEENIMNAEAEVERIESLFSSPDFYDKYSAQITTLNTELEAARGKVKQLYFRWEELEELKKRMEEE